MDSQHPGTSIPMRQLDVPLDTTLFFPTLIRTLAGALEEVIGLEDASGFISLVGQSVGADINEMYRGALQVSQLSRHQVAEVLVDLKARIEGGFSLVEESDERLVFINSACPFGDSVIDRPSMCMMTSNVFGSISADNLGYAKVVILESIATRHSGCKVVVYLTHNDESAAQEGREYFGN